MVGVQAYVSHLATIWTQLDLLLLCVNLPFPNQHGGTTYTRETKGNGGVDVDVQASEEEAMRGFQVQRTACREVQCPEQLLYYLGRDSTQSKSLQVTQTA